MSDAATLKDFLVGIGFKVDQIAQKQAEEAVRRTEERNTDRTEKESEKRRKIEAKEAADREKERKGLEKKELERRAKSLKDAQSYVLKMSAFAVKAVAAVEASAIGVVYAVDKAAKSFERLNYMSQRTGSAPGRIGAFGYASNQLGSSAEEANSSLESFGQKLRINGSGYAQALERLRIKARDANGHLRDSADLATDLGDALRRIQQEGGQYGYSNAITQASVLGFDENTTRALMNPDFRKRESEYKSDQKAVGADPDAAAKTGTAFEQSMGHLNEVLGQIETKLADVLFKKLKPLLDDLSDWFTAHGDKVADIIGRVADDLVKLAKAIADKIAGADWNAILDNVEQMAQWFDVLAKKLTGDSGLTALFGLFGAALALKVLSPLVKILTAMSTLGGLALPPWLLAMLGVGATAVAAGDAAKGAFDKGFNAVSPGQNTPEMLENQHMSLWDRTKRVFRNWGFGNSSPDDVVKKYYHPSRGDNGGAPPPTDGPEATTPGVYRPQYLLSQADLSDSVVNKIAGEAKNTKESTDAVINNMLNRVGTKAYGPSANLAQVAYAPGQYAAPGNRRTSASRAEFIRSRIRAIAAGQVPDNTGGSNEYRASGYFGPWYRHHADAPVVGGNRFAYNAQGGRGTYSPYDHPVLPMPSRFRAGAPLKNAPALPAPPGVPQGMTGGGYMALGLDASGRPVRLGDTPALHQSIANSTRGDTVVTHNPTFNITGGDGPATLEAARRMASRGHQDLLRNIQGMEQ